MINKILLQLCIWLVYRQVVMHQHFQKFIKLFISTNVAEHDLRNIFFSFSRHRIPLHLLFYIPIFIIVLGVTEGDFLLPELLPAFAVNV